MAATYTYDAKSLLRDGRRWFPVMGEIHYSRYPEAYWKEALLKMKAGGVDIVSSYVIWIHHEEVEGEWKWDGGCDLRRFVHLVGECGMAMVLRVGPWSHAEVRNGGFPDWLLAKCGSRVRTNDEAYFAEVEAFFRQIYAQVRGLFAKDGGAIIGVQVENEYGHCGGLTGAEGEAHIRRLAGMLRGMGFDAPLYTATGWGGAVTAGLLPVMGGYCDAPWDPRTTEIEPSGNFVFTHERNDHAIGSDYGLGEGVTFDMAEFPYLTAELGGGLQVTYRRRPVATARDIAAMSVAKMGSGCTLLGYYMYHGGTNPDGRLSTLQESSQSGSLCDLLEKNYDFRAPLGEYGAPNDTYRYLRRLALFVHDYGEELAGMDTYIPADNPVTPENFTDLRYSLRYSTETGRGFLFISNYQRRNELLDHYGARIHFDVPVRLDATVDVRNGEFMILPVAAGRDGAAVVGAMPLLCKLGGHAVPYAPGPDAAPKGAARRFLSAEESLDAQKVPLENGKELLLISGGTVYCERTERGTRVYVECAGVPEFTQIVPVNVTSSYAWGSEGSYELTRKLGSRFIDIPAGFRLSGSFMPEMNEVVKKSGSSWDGLAGATYTYTASLPQAPAFSHRVLEAPGAAGGGREVVAVHVDAWPADHFGTLHDVFLDLSYTGNAARLYLDGRLVADDLYAGPGHQWHVGLRRFGREAHDFRLEVDPLQKGAPVYLEAWPAFGGRDSLCEVHDIGVSRTVRVGFTL